VPVSERKWKFESSPGHHDFRYLLAIFTAAPGLTTSRASVVSCTKSRQPRRIGDHGSSVARSVPVQEHAQVESGVLTDPANFRPEEIDLDFMRQLRQ
jgi:hypothetical protein